jgi:MFS family permease
MRVGLPRLRWPSGLAAIRERNFALYVFGHFVSQSGNWLESTATAWIVYELTDSPFLLGLSGLFRAAPVLLLTLVGGAVADRFPKRPLLYVTETTQLSLNVVVALLAAGGRLEFWHLYLLNALNATMSAFSVPARQAMFPGLVPRSAVASAVTFNAVAVRSSSLVGPSLAGLALATSGYAAPFVLNALSYLGMLAALIAMKLPKTPTPVREARPSLGQGMAEGIRFVWSAPVLRPLVGLEVIAGFFGHNTALITIIARDRLSAGPDGLGLLLSAIASGALVSMLLMMLFPVDRRGLMIIVAGLTYCSMLFGFALSGSLPLAAGLLFCLGAADGVWSVSRNTVAHLAVPDHLRGRVMSVVILTSRGFSLAGQVQSGTVAALFGGPAAAMIGATVVASGVFFSTIRSTAVRQFRVTPTQRESG